MMEAKMKFFRGLMIALPISILMWLVIIKVCFGATYYVDATSGSDSSVDPTNISTPWKTIAKVNASSFNAGDSILFKKGETWREQLTVPSSGSAGSPITFGAYGSGANPIINGADIITPGTSWAASSSWSTNFTLVYSSNSGAATNHNVRNLIPANTFSYSGTKIRITLYSHTGDIVINGASIGVSTTHPTFDATPTRITFSSGNTVTVTEGNSVVSDEITYSYDKTLQNLIQFYYTGNAPNNIVSGGIGYGFKGEYASGSDKTMETSIGTVGYTSTNQTRIITKFEVYSAITNSWQTVLTTEPKVVMFDGTLGQAKASAAACTSARDWFWESNVLYVYAASDPDTLYTSPGIEAGKRNYAIYGTGKSYITVDGLNLKGANSGALTMQAADGVSGGNWIVSNNTINDSYFGVAVFTYSATQFGGSNLITGNTIQNIVLDGMDAYGHKGSGSGTETTFSHNTITGVRRFGGYFRCNYWIIENNDFHNNGTSGSASIAIEIQSENDSDGCGQYNIIRRNIIYGQNGNDVDAVGIELDHWTTENQIYYNVIYANQGIGIAVYNATNQYIYNNVVYGNCLRATTSDPAEIKIYGDGVATIDNSIVKNNIGYATGASVSAIMVLGALATASTLNITNNVWYAPNNTNWYYWNATAGNNLATWNALTGVGTDLNSDPLFVNAAGGNFYLQSTSPARDAGTDVGLTQDYAGRPVPYNSTPDIGALEFGRGIWTLKP